MCGRTASTRPPNVLIRVTGAARYIPAAPRPQRPRGGGGRGGGRGGGNQRGRGAGQRQRQAPQQRYQQHNQQLEQPAEEAEAKTADDDHTAAGDEEKEAEQDDSEQYSDAYRPSYNAGPHFYLPVLRYVKNGKDNDDDDEVDGSEDRPSERSTRRATEESARAEERQQEEQRMAADEDFTTDGRDDVATFNPASTLPPPTATPKPDSSSTPTGDPSVELVLQPMRWGLIPRWTSATSLAAADAAQSYNMINARAESVDQAKSYRGLVKRRRCCVVVDSYYEWHTQTINGRTKKQPFSFVPNHHTPPITDSHATSAAAVKPLSRYDRTSDDKPFFLLAGLYDTWTDPSTSSVVYSITILTTSAAQKLGWCHERQPVILSHSNALRWLDVWNVPWGEELRSMVCRPWSEGVSWYKVPECVGSVRNQVSECTQPLEEYMAAKKAAGIGKFFGANATTPGKAAEEERQEGAKLEPTGIPIANDGMKHEDGASAELQSGVKVEVAGSKDENGGVKQEQAPPGKREREDSASTVLRTPEKRMKVENRASRSVSPASGGSVAKKEEVGSKSQLSLTSFFGKV